MKKQIVKELVKNIIEKNDKALKALALASISEKTRAALEKEKLNLVKQIFTKNKVKVQEAIESNVDILAKLQEIIEKDLPGKVTLKNGEAVDVDVATANLLITVFNALTDDNREEMTSLLNSSLDNFMKVVDFAYKNTR